MSKTYDIVIFGASGYTGSFITEELARVASEKFIKWAVAGRSEQKVRNCLKESADFTKISMLTTIPFIKADITDQNSLIEMAKSTKLIINAVGPYQKYGERVIKACIEANTHSIDISGEPLYLELMQLKYNEVAMSKGIFLIGACGADSIPAEMGVIYTMKQFNGRLNEVESYLSADSVTVNTGTLESALLGLSQNQRQALRDTRRQLFRNTLPEPDHKQRKRGHLFKSTLNNQWSLQFPSSDKSVVNRSQRYLFENGKIERAVQYAPYICEKSLFSVFRMALCGLMILISSKIAFLRDAFLKFPRIFSLGLFSSAKATRKDLANSNFEMFFIGRGWSGKNSETSEKQPMSVIKTKVSGPELGYISCSIFAVQSALTVLEEKDKMPVGGAISPGAAFYDTNFIERLRSRRIRFDEIVS